MQIIGIGYGSISTLQNWAEDEGFRYELWQDVDRTLAVHFGAASSASSWAPSRKTVLLDGDGNHILSYDVGLFSISGHPSDVLEDCEAIWGAR